MCLLCFFNVVAMLFYALLCFQCFGYVCLRFCYVFQLVYYAFLCVCYICLCVSCAFSKLLQCFSMLKRKPRSPQTTNTHNTPSNQQQKQTPQTQSQPRSRCSPSRWSWLSPQGRPRLSQPALSLHGPRRLARRMLKHRVIGLLDRSSDRHTCSTSRMDVQK